MSESQSDAPETSAAESEDAETGTVEKTAPEVDWKAKAREWERKAKGNAAAAKKLAEIEDAAKTEAQRTSERIAALEAENAGYKAAAQARQWAEQVSKKTGVPAAVLRGSTLEEVEAHAAAIRSTLGTGRGPAVPNEGTGKPKAGGKADAFAALVEDQLKR